MKDFFLLLWHIPRYVFSALIWLYQKTLSPDHSFWAKVFFPDGYCKYYPSCSEYGKKAFLKHGVFKGFFKTFYRIIRCNPWSKGGVDEL